MIFPIFSLSPLLALFALSTTATPLSRRDVVAPAIITPNAQSVWPIGTTQTVTWDTSNLPPPSQITNPLGQIILGHNSSDSLNLDFNHPLAKGFKITDGHVQITVPNVPPRPDYLIVLFGDSGDTSPAFAITEITAGSGSSSSQGGSGASPTTSSAGNAGGDKAASTSTLITTPIPITGSVITGGSTGTATDSVPASATQSDSSSAATATSPVSSSASASGSAASSSASSAPSKSAAWSVHRTDNNSLMTLAMCMIPAIILVMTY